MRCLILSGLLGILLIVPYAQATTISLTTGIAGANTQADLNHATIINFNVLSGNFSRSGSMSNFEHTDEQN